MAAGEDVELACLQLRTTVYAIHDFSGRSRPKSSSCQPPDHRLQFCEARRPQRWTLFGQRRPSRSPNEATFRGTGLPLGVNSALTVDAVMKVGDAEESVPISLVLSENWDYFRTVVNA